MTTWHKYPETKPPQLEHCKQYFITYEINGKNFITIEYYFYKNGWDGGRKVITWAEIEMPEPYQEGE